jgi:hypothetical protein
LENLHPAGLGNKFVLEKAGIFFLSFSGPIWLQQTLVLLNKGIKKYQNGFWYSSNKKRESA